MRCIDKVDCERSNHVEEVQTETCLYPVAYSKQTANDERYASQCEACKGCLDTNVRERVLKHGGALADHEDRGQYGDPDTLNQMYAEDEGHPKSDRAPAAELRGWPANHHNT